MATEPTIVAEWTDARPDVLVADALRVICAERSTGRTEAVNPGADLAGVRPAVRSGREPLRFRTEVVSVVAHETLLAVTLCERQPPDDAAPIEVERHDEIRLAHKELCLAHGQQRQLGLVLQRGDEMSSVTCHRDCAVTIAADEPIELGGWQRDFHAGGGGCSICGHAWRIDRKSVV